MISILEITTTEAVRAVFGADGVSEMTDQDLIGSNLPFELQVDLDQWLEPVKPSAEIISEGTAPGATAEQVSLYRTLQIYGKYFCAWVVANSSNFTLLETMSDGQTEVRRPKRDLEKLLERITGLLNKYRKIVLEGAGTTSAGPPSFFSVAPPDYDPVTDEET